MKILLILLILFTPIVAHADIQITQEQFENLDILHEKLAARYSKFKGFNGTKDSLEVIGISDETALTEIEIIDLPTEIQKKKKEKDDKKIKKLDLVLEPRDEKINEIIDYLNSKEE